MSSPEEKPPPVTWSCFSALVWLCLSRPQGNDWIFGWGRFLMPANQLGEGGLPAWGHFSPSHQHTVADASQHELPVLGAQGCEQWSKAQVVNGKVCSFLPFRPEFRRLGRDEAS